MRREADNENPFGASISPYWSGNVSSISIEKKHNPAFTL
jgi:hypothetical protein